MPEEPEDTPSPESPDDSYVWLSHKTTILAWVLPGLLLLSPILLSTGSGLGAMVFVILLLLAVFGTPVIALVAVLSGRAARSQLRSTKSADPRELARVEDNLGCSYIALLGSSVFFVVCALIWNDLRHARESPRVTSCQNNLKQLGLVLKMYANEDHDGQFPELSPERGRLAMLNGSKPGSMLCPEFITDTSILVCPSTQRPRPTAPKTLVAQDSLNNSDYIYLGYAITSEETLEAFAAEYRRCVEQGSRFSEDLYVARGLGSWGDGRIRRLCDRIENPDPESEDPIWVALAASRTPALIERLGHHKPEGGNVLYLDGHVEFLSYPGKWPMTEEAVRILRSLEDLRNDPPVASPAH